MHQSPEYANHARARLSEALVLKAVSKYTPALEAYVRMRVSEEMLREEDRDRGRGTSGLVRASAARLSEMERGREKWSYTRRHSMEVAYFSYIIASEVKERNAPGGEGVSPEACFAGGFVHDIGKTFLPLGLVVKELGVDLVFFCLFEGHKLNDNERSVLRDEHLSAGTRFVRLFDGQENQVLHDMVGLHHVMYNGRGSMFPSYPAHLVGYNLPIQSRIAKTADFLSAVLPRHYRHDEWVHSMKDSVGYAIAVSGVELDPLTVSCYITGTHDVSAEEADALIMRLRYPGGISDIANFKMMREYVRSFVEKDPDFQDMLTRRARHRIMYYQDRIRECAGKLGAPTLEDLHS